MFPKDTIMGQVLDEVADNKRNRLYMELIDDLLTDINSFDYLDYNGPNWNKLGLLIADCDIIHYDITNHDDRWTYLETPFSSEFSWLVYALSEIYQPSPKSAIRLYSTIGFLLEVYSEKYEDLVDILTMTAMISVVWLHPDHLKEDQFIVHPNNLPNFGKEF